MFALVEEHERSRSLELYALGVTVSLAFNNPDLLKTLLEEPASPVEPTGMLKIPKKRKP